MNPRLNNHRWTILLAVLLTSLTLGCGDSDSDTSNNEPTAPTSNIVETAAADASFGTLVAALQATGLDATLASADATFTVFAPTDAAFEAVFAGLGTTAEDFLAEDNLDTAAAFLTYHVLDSAVDAATAISLDGQTAATVQGEEIAISVVDGAVVINADSISPATVTEADIMASNGIIHRIDAVIIPPTIAADSGSSDGCGDGICNGDETALTCEADCAEASSECGDGVCGDDEDAQSCAADCDAAGPGNLVEEVVALGSHTILAEALTTANLIDTLSGETAFTVFAPGDAAFQAYFAATNTTKADLLTLENLADILTYHVVAGSVNAEAAIALAGQSADSVQGEPIAITVVDGNVVLNGSATVVSPDVPASNGIIHIIDAVMLPPSIAPPVDPPADKTFCETYVETCGAWPVAETSCADWWAAADAGAEGDTTGATQGCYSYHLDVAGSMTDEADIAMHCAHAIGAADMSGSAPCNGNLADVATGAGFSTLVAALEAAALAGTIANDGPFTVFAPTNEAFENFISMSVDFASAEELLAFDGLADVLLYHVVDGVVPAATAITLTEAPTKQGSTITIDATDGVVLNGSINVTATDVYASNGVIHIIDGVLMPPAPKTFCESYAETCGDWPVAETSCADWWGAAAAGAEGDTTGATQGCYAYHLGVAATMSDPAAMDMHCAHAIGAADMDGYAPCNGNLAEVATDAGFSTLVAALEAAALAETIANDGPFTVFAPTDEAFENFIAMSVDFASAEELLAFDGLADVLLYHVVDGVVPAATAVTLTEAPTKQGSAIAIDATDGVVLNGSINVTATDVYASNGVVHVIDGVLMPPVSE